MNSFGSFITDIFTSSILFFGSVLVLFLVVLLCSWRRNKKRESSSENSLQRLSTSSLHNVDQESQEDIEDANVKHFYLSPSKARKVLTGRPMNLDGKAQKVC